MSSDKDLNQLNQLGSSYRDNIGSRNPCDSRFIKNMGNEILNMWSTILHTNLCNTEKNKNIDSLFSLIKVLRSSCVEPAVAEQLLNLNFVNKILFSLSEKIISADSSVQIFFPSNIYTAIFQLISNYCCCGDLYASNFWNSVVSTGFHRYIVFCNNIIHSRHCLGAFIAAVYNCIHKYHLSAEVRLICLLNGNS